MKIAFVSGFYVDKDSNMSQNNIDMFQIMFDSAKKYFLKDYDVDFIFITNTDVLLNGVKNLKIEKDIVGYQHILLMKVLCYEFVQDYDYVFVSDGDQIFVNEILKSDLLENDFNIMRHFFKPKIKGILPNLTQFVDIKGDIENREWTMGNFFGGKKEVFKELYNSAKKWDQQYRGNIQEGVGFYAKYPDEVFIVKFFNENKYDLKYLSTVVNPLESTSKYFLSSFYVDELFVEEGIKNVKVIHDTKKDINFLKEKFKKYYE